MKRRLLILGGTGEAAMLARHLTGRADLDIVSSLAGRVAAPSLPTGAVRVGGFGGVDGLAAYLKAERIDAVVDATHPFAARMSWNAAEACRRVRVPLLTFVRPAWQPQANDRWLPVADIAAAASLCRGRVFLTVGRQELAPFAAVDAWFLIRTIDPPDGPLPTRHALLLARGPFALADEIDLMRVHAIDLVVSKNSGGPATYAKIAAARALGLPVVMVERPARPATDEAGSLEAVVAWLDRPHHTP
ncbi:precorrin-6A reductase [Aliidongia dinghuensis]|uniref:Precorrin-6A reductase n=1 Tax=Aliidongia dinghuensis TaxID=1867774 RepID=A0A8J3E1Y4_9PROT|nr:cobalt-precorrin-6A reductase [Aliidongia dinghuensis]GGF06073.1 precorrin-6A reductase [Aliidongia dinghuensis]